MKTIASKEAQNNFGTLLDMAQREPVTIQRHGRDVAVLMSKQDFERLERLEDSYWVSLAEKGLASPILTPEESAAFIKEMLDRADD